MSRRVETGVKSDIRGLVTAGSKLLGCLLDVQAATQSASSTIELCSRPDLRADVDHPDGPPSSIGQHASIGRNFYQISGFGNAGGGFGHPGGDLARSGDVLRGEDGAVAGTSDFP